MAEPPGLASGGDGVYRQEHANPLDLGEFWVAPPSTTAF
jgi:hypothetical protein